MIEELLRAEFIGEGKIILGKQGETKAIYILQRHEKRHKALKQEEHNLRQNMYMLKTEWMDFKVAPSDAQPIEILRQMFQDINQRQTTLDNKLVEVDQLLHFFE